MRGETRDFNNRLGGTVVNGQQLNTWVTTVTQSFLLRCTNMFHQKARHPHSTSRLPGHHQSVDVVRPQQHENLSNSKQIGHSLQFKRLHCRCTFKFCFKRYRVGFREIILLFLYRSSANKLCEYTKRKLILKTLKLQFKEHFLHRTVDFVPHHLQ